MSPSIVTSQRSTSGCWTCRLRRKKCMEGGLPCLTCKARGITCHGYGPKPAWKDRGEKEKEELKRITEQCSAKRRSRATSLADVLSAPVQTTAMSTTPLNFGWSAAMEVDTTVESPGINLFNQHEIWNFLEFPVAGHEPIEASTQDMGESDISLASDEQVAMIPAPVRVDSMLEISVPEPEHKGVDDEEQADLIMSYITTTFFVQFPSYISADRNGWLLILLNSSPWFSKVTLSLAAYHQYLVGCSLNDLRTIEESFEAFQKYRNRALIASQPSDQALLVVGAFADFEKAVSSTQLAILESLTGNVNNWQPHLKIAVQCFQRCGFDILTVPSPRKRAMEVYGALLLSADILSSTLAPTQYSKSSFDIYRRMLNEGYIDLQAVFGYENWIMVVMMDIVELECWKLEEEKSGNLGIRDLVKRAEKIEATIDEKMANVPNGTQAPMAPLVNAVFASAASVYTNTVVSGAKPLLSDVQDAVQKSVVAWEQLGSLSNLHMLKWPYLVTACLATGDQRKVFRDIISTVSGDQVAFWNSSQLKAIVEGCWKCFDSTQQGDLRSSCDWRISCRRLAMNICLA